ncbi:unnamed protein product [Schistosoma mattheei]|uniref:Uncharacterized protein n=1 Tax=Schistosoma mattheei TaxID=31246 RepID=A0A183Q203_9TREM|nr:unnamed protein product [Schistosoma mattheei]
MSLHLKATIISLFTIFLIYTYLCFTMIFFYLFSSLPLFHTVTFRLHNCLFLAFRCCYCNHFNPARSTRLKTGLSTENIENTNDLLNNSKTTPSLLSTKSNLKRMNEAIQRSSKTNLYSHDSDDNDSVLGNNETVVCDSHEISINTFNEQLNLKDSADVDKFRESME